MIKMRTTHIGISIPAGVLVLSVLFGAVLVIPYHTSAQYIPSVTLTFPASQEVEVYPGANGTAVFSGKLTVSCNYATSTEISVNSRSLETEEWIVGISPSNVSCEPGINVETNVTVVVWVPPETKQMAGNIELLAETHTTVPGVSTSNEGSATIQVQVKPYYMLSIGCGAPYKESVDGSNVTFCVEVKNLGNAIVDVTIGLENSDEISEWRVIFPTDIMFLDAKETKIINISVEPPQNITQLIGTTHKIIIKATSFFGNISDNYSLYVKILDITKPVISNVLSAPSVQVQGEYINITSTVCDNIAVSMVKVNISGPADFMPINITMTKIPGTNNYYYNLTCSIAGIYSYYIWAKDTSNNQDISTVCTFEIEEEKKAEHKGFIPGFEAIIVIIAISGVVLALKHRKR